MSETIRIRNTTRYTVVIGDGKSSPFMLERKGGEEDIPVKIWKAFMNKPSAKTMLEFGSLEIVEPKAATENENEETAEIDADAVRAEVEAKLAEGMMGGLNSEDAEA